MLSSPGHMCWACAPIVSPACGTVKARPRDSSRVANPESTVNDDGSCRFSRRAVGRFVTLPWQRDHRESSAPGPSGVTVVADHPAERHPVAPGGHRWSLRLSPPEPLRLLLLLFLVPFRLGARAGSAPRPPRPPSAAAGGSPRRFQTARWRPASRGRSMRRTSRPASLVKVRTSFVSAARRLRHVVGDQRAVRRIRRGSIAPRRLRLRQLVEEVGVAQREDAGRPRSAPAA